LLKEILEEKNNELSPYLKIHPFFFQNFFNPDKPLKCYEFFIYL
jgi:hypothetical protein